jgi:hypothetical protein
MWRVKRTGGISALPLIRRRKVVFRLQPAGVLYTRARSLIDGLSSLLLSRFLSGHYSFFPGGIDAGWIRTVTSISQAIYCLL